jgi:type IV secretory pathway VirB10-like protein
MNHILIITKKKKIYFIQYKMPYKSGKLKGQLTAPELRRMIKEHNKLMSIKVPPKTDRDGLISLINKNGYKVDHENKKLVPTQPMKRRPTIKLPPAPTPKTAEEKAEAKKKKEKKKLEENLKLKMKVEKVKSKVSESEKKAETKKASSTQTEAPKLVLKKNQSKTSKSNYSSPLDFISQYEARGWKFNEPAKDFIKKQFADKSKKIIVREEKKGKNINLYFVGDDNKLGSYISAKM